MFGPAGPNLLPVDDVMITALFGKGGDRCRVRAAARFGNAKGLQAQSTTGNLRQVLRLLRLGPVPQQAAHDIHLRMASGPVGPRALDLF